MSQPQIGPWFGSGRLDLYIDALEQVADYAQLAWDEYLKHTEVEAKEVVENLGSALLTLDKVRDE